MNLSALFLSIRFSSVGPDEFFGGRKQGATASAGAGPRGTGGVAALPAQAPP
jgi:hypothetical protein